MFVCGKINKTLAHSLEYVVFLFFETNDNVTGFESGFLITLAVEHNLLTVYHTLINVNLKYLPVSHGLFAVTAFATIPGMNSFTDTPAVRTRALQVLNHRRSQLLYDDVHTGTLANGTPFDRSLLASDA